MTDSYEFTSPGPIAMGAVEGQEWPGEVPPKHGNNCTQINGRCISMHCLRCGEPTGPQGCFTCFPNRGGEKSE